MARDKTRIAERVKEAAEAVGRVDAAAQFTIAEMAEAMIETLSAGGRMYVCGNGGSAADAQHIAAELTVRFRRNRRPLPCAALTTDTSVLTAIGNDFDFQDVFARQVEALGRQGDVLLALSTSGASPNILSAARAARKRGMKVLAMTGSGGGELAGQADVCFFAPSQRTDLVQQLHQLAYHILCELIEEHFSAGE